MTLSRCLLQMPVPVRSVWWRSRRKQVLNCCLALVTLAMTAGSAGAVEVITSPPLWKDVNAFPRVAGEDPVVRRINATLQKADDRLGRAVRGCAKTSRQPRDLAGAWKRSVRVTTHGPNFLSLVADDVSFCGGAHPDSGTLALVFDLQTGQLVDWRTLLPASLIQSTPLDEALDGGKIGLISSDKLAATYGMLYPTRPQNDISNEDWSSCREAVGEARAFLAWPAVKPNGLAVQPADLPHVVAACGVPVIVPTAMLRSLGVSQSLTDALDAAR